MAAACLVLIMLAGLVTVGRLCYLVGRDDQADEFEDERHALDAEWTALEQTRRVNDVFFNARRALRDAAERPEPRRGARS